MATLVLGVVGTAIGGAFGGAILDFSGAAIGGFIGSTVGSVVDSWIVSSLAPAQRIEGARLDTLRITSATEGAVTVTSSTTSVLYTAAQQTADWGAPLGPGQTLATHLLRRAAAP